MYIVEFKVLNKKWKIRILEKKKYTKRYGEDSVAITLAYRRLIYLHPEGLDLETIVHELVHAFMSELCIKSTNEITPDDLEEIFAELMAKRGKELLQLADELFFKIHNKVEINKKLDTLSEKKE
jgi:hypothetical protein